MSRASAEGSPITAGMSSSRAMTAAWDDEAASFLAEAVDSFDALGHQCCLAHSLERVAWFADETARPVDALRLLAAAEALRRTIGSTVTLRQGAVALVRGIARRP